MAESESPRPTREQADAALAEVARGYVGPRTARVLAAEVRALRAELAKANIEVGRAWLALPHGPHPALHDDSLAGHIRAALVARTPQSTEPGGPSTGDLLRAAAAGRREYAGPEREGGSGNAKVDEMREVLLTQAATLDGAAKVADGDLGPLYGWLPSWRWTAEMDRRVLAGTSDSTTRADAAALAPAAPLPAVPDGEDAACLNCGLPLGPPEAWGQAEVGPVHHGCPDDAEDGEDAEGGEDVPARLDAAADALAAADLARGAAALRDAASVASIAGPDVRAAVAAALARPTEPQR